MGALTPDTSCERLAARQHGVLARAQALELGLTPRAIGRRLATGRWERPHPRVYRPTSTPPSWRSALMGAILWAGSEGLVSHRAAGRLYELHGVGDAPVEISARIGRRLPGVVVHRLRSEDQPRQRIVDGFPTTRPERTLLDMAAVLPIDRAGLALDDALRRDLTSLAKLRRIVRAEGRSGRDGTGTMRRLLAVRDEADAEMESVLESRLLRLLRRAGAPMPAPQYEVRDRGRLVARLDFAYPELRLGIETYGYRWHAGRERWQRDIRRENRLKQLGWMVLVYTWDDVVGDETRVVEEVSRALTRRAGHGNRPGEAAGVGGGRDR